MTTVWTTVIVLKCRRLHCLCMPYILSNVQIYTLLYVEYCLKETVSKCFNYWEYGRSPNIYLHPSVIVRPWLTTWSTIPLISSDMRLCSWPLLPLPLFCLCTLPHSSLLLFFLSAVDPGGFLDVHPSSEFINCCVVLCLYAIQLKVHETHLWALSENWYIIGWSIFSSLVKVRIHLHNSWQIYIKSNKNV